MHQHVEFKITKWIFVPCPCCNGKRKVINGQWLRNKRESTGMDQRAFGKLVDMSGPYVSDIERNRRDCPVHILDAYLKLK